MNISISVSHHIHVNYSSQAQQETPASQKEQHKNETMTRDSEMDSEVNSPLLPKKSTDKNKSKFSILQATGLANLFGGKYARDKSASPSEPKRSDTTETIIAKEAIQDGSLFLSQQTPYYSQTQH